MRIQQDIDLSDRTSFGIGGRASYLVEPSSVEELAEAIQWASSQSIAVYPLGAGCNVLISDNGLNGLVVDMSRYQDLANELEPTEAGVIRCKAGTPLKRLIHASLQAGLEGLDLLVGIPGTVGGSVFGNAGSRGRELGDFVKRALLVDLQGQAEWVDQVDLGFRYRASKIAPRIIAEVEFQFSPGNKEDLVLSAKKLFNLKRETQPLGAKSAGCIFRNPSQDSCAQSGSISTQAQHKAKSAGQLIEEAGLKGCRVGNAVVSDLHANFIVNDGQASAQEVEQLIQKVIAEVRQSLGVQLECEIRSLS